MLKIRDLRAGIEGKEILKGVSLEVKPGEVHAVMGVNGSGKSTLANILGGREEYEILSGSILYKGKDLMELSPEERACEGIFLAFQYPVELPGVLGSYFLRTAYNSIRRYRGEEEMKVREFAALLTEKAKELDLSEELLSRAVNEGFSGGEKKRNEIFQMSVLEPELAVLDETDSGLDIDALRTVAEGVNAYRKDHTQSSVIVITHYQRLLNFIVPDKVHVMMDGRIVESGDKDLALLLEEKGYTGFNPKEDQADR